jgi:hypothetical protein
MLKKITLATALVLSIAGSAVAANDGRGGGDGYFDRANASACERPAAPNICK